MSESNVALYRSRLICDIDPTLPIDISRENVWSVALVHFCFNFQLIKINFQNTINHKLYVQLDQVSICAKIYQDGLASMKYFKWCCRPGSNLQVRDTLHCLHLFAIILVSLLVQSWHDGHVIHHMLLMVWQQICLVSFTEHSPQFYKPSDIH